MPRKKIHARKNAKKKKSHSKKKVKKKIHAEGRSNCDFFTHSKKNLCRGVHLKKKFLHKQWAKKKICASWKFPTPPPPHHFSNGPSLSKIIHHHYRHHHHHQKKNTVWKLYLTAVGISLEISNFWSRTDSYLQPWLISVTFYNGSSQIAVNLKTTRCSSIGLVVRK